MSTIPPHIAITWQPRSVYEPGKRGVPSARPSTTISSDTCKPVTQPLSPDAQAAVDAFTADSNGVWLEGDLERLAAALRTITDRVVPHSPTEAISFTNEAIRLNRMGIRCKYLAIATELEGHQ